jgi:hypothetical protein
VEAAESRIIPLPSSSPGLSPIGEMFSKVEAMLRSVVAWTTRAITAGIGPDLRDIPPKTSWGWFPFRAVYAIQA